jgi:hypothetical protein
MLYFRRSRFVRVIVLPLTLVSLQSACTSYVAMQSPYGQTILREEPGRIRVTLDDGSRVTISQPRIEGDSLLGFAYDAKNRAYTDTVRVALAEVTSVEREKADLGKSFNTVVLVGGVVVLGGLIAMCSSDEFDC